MKNKSPKSKRAIAKQLRKLSEYMTDISASMDYYGGLSEWAKHGAELAGAATVVRYWADEIDPPAKFMDDIDGRALASAGF